MGALPLDQAFSGDHQQRFCERILSFARDGVPQGLLDMLKLDELQRGNLDRLGEYLTLCEAVGPRRYRDAFHLWTALCNGFDYFLTTDDARASYEELKARGVEFVEEPEERPYGIDSGFRDPSGNSFRLTQVRELSAV